MDAFQSEFIQLALQKQALKFGEFTLKSGRISPYFFNMGAFNTGADLLTLGQSYAETVVRSGIEFDMVFGPAYKGIPLACALAIQLAQQHAMEVPYAFNRKEDKDHGEGGMIVGAPLQGNVLIVDDVMTAGTAVKQTLELIQRTGAEPAGVVLALDRQERGTGITSAVQEIEQTAGIPVCSIIALEHILEHSTQDTEAQTYTAAIQAYQQTYGV